MTHSQEQNSGKISAREPGVSEYLSHFIPFINARPMLLSLLYDIDMLPEQTVTKAGAMRLGGLCEVWRMGEEGKLHTPSPSSQGDEQ